MRTGWMKGLAVRYFEEISRDSSKEKLSQEEIDYRAERFVEDVDRTLSARADFKNVKEGQ